MIELADPNLMRSQCYVDGRFVGEPIEVVLNPSTGRLIGLVPIFGEAETENAVMAAKESFSTWKVHSPGKRSSFLKSWHRLIVSHREDLAILITSEQGKPLAESLAEIDHAAAYVEFYAEEARRIHGEVLAAPDAEMRMLVLRQPMGVVAAITPWNFPAAMVTRKVAPALAAGCTVVLKPAPQTPFTALALAELAHRAGIPRGVLNILTGHASAIGSVMTAHPAVRVLTFTGSTATGKLLARQSVPTVKKVLLELGGNAPFIVFDDADLDAAVEGAVASKFRNSGQTCVCANRFYVQDKIYDMFVERLARAVEKLVVGDGFDPATTQGPLIDEAAVLKVERHVDDAISHGALLVTGGCRIGTGSRIFAPTVLKEVKEGMLITREETFGPVAPVIRFETEEDVIAAANDSPFGLAAYFYTRDLARSVRVMERLEAGMVGVNTGRMSSELAPFGGVKESGNSREGSRHGILEFTELKYCCIGGIGEAENG